MEKEKQHTNCMHYIVCGLIGCLIAIMLVVVVSDRCKFHHRVYEAAYQSAFTMKCKCQQRDFVADSSKVSIDSSAIIISHPGHSGDESTLLDALSKSDGLLSANGLTYLVTLIVALLASLLLTKIDAMEKAIESNKKLKENISKLEEKVSQSLAKIEEQEKNFSEFKVKIESYYKNITNYDHILNRIASAFNLSVMISNVTTSLSIQREPEENRRIAKEAGVLCSRLSLICEQIDTKILDYLTTDEKSILNAYLEDALSALYSCKGSAKKINEYLENIIEHLVNIIDDAIVSINAIKDGVDNVEVRDE